MTSDELRQALDDLCEADGDEKKAREAVREAGEELKAVSARRDALAASVAPVLRANRGRICKAKAWNGLMRRLEDRAVYIDEHGCVAVEPLSEHWDMTIPEEAAASEEAVIPEEAVESPSPSRPLPSRPLPSDDVSAFDDDPCIAERRAPVGRPAELVAMGGD